MHHKRGQHGLRGAGRPSFLGDGLLERARATSMALLGATAAVGLSIVALALNQGWPLVAASSIPPLPRQERGVGPAAALAPAPTSRPGPTGKSHGDSRRDRSPTRVASVVADAGAGVGAPAGVVVSSSEPVERSGGGDHDGVTDHSGGTDHVAPKPPAKAPPQPPPVQQAPVTTVVSSPPEPEPAPAPTPEPAPVASASETPPEESGPPPWSHGGGHAYGRNEDWHGHDGSEGGD